ncbi:MAG TPA: hypothetical protein VFY79_09175 [Dehalococcoidia bacterium]|nr:hypothetical protein [Dehalococcoidia bacterium]
MQRNVTIPAFYAALGALGLIAAVFFAFGGRAPARSVEAQTPCTTAASPTAKPAAAVAPAAVAPVAAPASTQRLPSTGNAGIVTGGPMRVFGQLETCTPTSGPATATSVPATATPTIKPTATIAPPGIPNVPGGSGAPPPGGGIGPISY